MSQVLEKPILLDETGQAIAGKLDTNADAIVDVLEDIKDAIGTSSEFIPVSLRVITPPTKTIYKVGERLDLTGMVVNLIGSNGVQIDVTSACTFSPANGTSLTTSDTSVAISYVYQHESTTFTTSQALTIRELSSIAVTTQPTKTAYMAGEALDLTGIVVTATYSDGYTANVTSSCVYNPANGTILQSGDNSVAISYTEGSTTKTTSCAVGVKELASIAITTPPTETEYYVEDTLDLTGIVVTATYDDNSTAIVTNSCTFSPANGTVLTLSDTTVTASFTDGGVTKTATQAITVTAVSYGAEWDGTASTAWTRTDLAANFTDPVPYYSGMTDTPSSPFDNIAPWSGMTKVGTGGNNVEVKIPKFWYRIRQNGSSIKIQIADHAVDGFSVSPAHMDRGDGQGERDEIYVSRYYVTEANSGANAPKSKSGQVPLENTSNTTRSQCRAGIHGSTATHNYWQMDFATYFTIWLLYIVEFADWDCQSKIGKGNLSGSESNLRVGYTDSMPYHTGTTQSSRDTAGLGTQYRNIEGLWDYKYFWWLDGCYYDSNGLHIILNPSDFSDDTGGVLVGLPDMTGGYYPKKFSVTNVSGAFPLFIPIEAGGDVSTYTTDPWYFTPKPCIATGTNGLFTIRDYGVSDKTAYSNGIGSHFRYIRLPNNS